MGSAPAASRSGVARELGIAWLHLLVLWAFGFAEPLFQVLADSPDFFVARGNTRGDILVFALAATFVPPSILLLCEVALIPFPRPRRMLHLGFVAVLAAGLVLQVIGNWRGPPGAALIAASVALGAAGAVAYDRTRIVSGVLTALSPAPVVFLVIFLLLSPVSKLVLPQDQGSAAAGGPGSSTPVVLVVFDEFSGTSLADRHGSIDPSRFPNLAAFARHATWYRNATTVSDSTPMAVPAILSGLRPKSGSVPITSDYPQNLFTALGDRYSLNVSEPVTDLCPERLCGRSRRASAGTRLRALLDDLSVVSAHLVLPRDLRDHLPAVDRAFSGFRNGGQDAGASARGRSSDLPGGALENRPAQFDRFIAGVGRTTPKPQLNFLHMALPHTPWQYLPSGKAYLGADLIGLDAGGIWGSDRWLVEQNYQRYLLQLGYVDRQVGRLVKRLRRQNLYDRALIIVTADHGISFHAGSDRRVVDRSNSGDIASVPLLVKAPRQRVGSVSDSPALTIDILPTIAMTAGARLRKRVDGRPLGRTPRRTVLRVHSGKGDIRIPFPEFIHRRDAEVGRRLELFGARRGFAGVFAGGPDKDLIGRQATQVVTSGVSPYAVEFDAVEPYKSFDRGDLEVPAFVRGRLSGTARGNEPVAVAINGRIVAVTLSFAQGKDVRMAAMVPPGAFRPGANDVQALAITGRGNDRRVLLAGRSLTDAAIVRRRGQLAVKIAGGPAIRLEPGAVDGYVERVIVQGNRMTVTGWATDKRHRQPADRVLVFVDDRLIEGGAPSAGRFDLLKRYGIGVVAAGFDFSATPAGRPVRSPGRLRVVAVSGRHASELPSIPDGFRAHG